MYTDEEISRITQSTLDRSLRLLDNALKSKDKARFRERDAVLNPSKLEESFQSTKLSKYVSDRSRTFGSDISLSATTGDFKGFTESKPVKSPSTNFVNQISKSAQDRLFVDFMEAWQRSGSGEQDVFGSILDFIQCCSDAINLIQNPEDISRFNNIDDGKLSEIESERNTWKLIYSLYQDRILFSATDDEMESEEFRLETVSEKDIMQRLYKRKAHVREWQIVIDWLEGNSAEGVVDPGLDGFSDKAVAWENTLHQLFSKRAVPYKSTRELITELDPDAPRRQNKHLHDMDQDDEDRIQEQVFKEIRCGRLESAQSICVHAGQPWRAAILEGWKLYHDPTYSRNLTIIQREMDPVEGNPNRDIWKLCAWRMCEDSNMPLKARAALATYCGHLQSLLSMSVSWEDHLWSYMKTLVDVRVEREIRTLSFKTYTELPPNYWNNEVAVDSIFNELAANKDSNVRKEALAPDHVVQRCVILDTISQLMGDVSKWIQGSDMSVGNDTESVSPHFIRFLTHLILFLRQIGRSECDSVGDQVIEAYVKLLIEMKECDLVAWYVSQLPQEDQVYYYAAFLEEITESEDRETAITAATQAGLNIDLITKTVVENIRQQPSNIETVALEIQDVSPEDWAKISALDWLRFYQSQRTDLVIQANALIAYFLAAGNVMAARMAFNKVPEDAIGLIQPSSHSMEEDTFINIALNRIPKTIALATKEYLCYKAYLDADESFNDWFQHFHNAKPEEPTLPANYTFIEKVGFQHKHNQYKMDLERWKIAMENQTKTTKTLLFNVLTFPMGWLVDDVEADDPERLVQLNALRSVIIPKVTFLLHLVMNSTEDYSGCVALADVIASENHKLYKVFSKNRLQDLLVKIGESSLALLNDGKDALGFPIM